MARKRSRRSRSSTALAPRRSHAAAKHGAPRAQSGALGFVANSPRSGAFAAAILLGVAKARGWEIPYIETVGEAGSLALAGYALENVAGFKHPIVRHATTAFGVIALYELAQEHGGKGALAMHKKASASGHDEPDTAYPMR